jgi:hypothetical protein
MKTNEDIISINLYPMIGNQRYSIAIFSDNSIAFNCNACRFTTIVRGIHYDYDKIILNAENFRCYRCKKKYKIVNNKVYSLDEVQENIEEKPKFTFIKKGRKKKNA